MKKKFLSFVFFLIGILIFTLYGCGNDIDFTINFVVDDEIYYTLSTAGNETIALPANPTKENYTFDGWYWDKDVYKRPFTANSLLDEPLSSDMSVYAKFVHIHADTDWTITSSVDATEDTEGSITYTCGVCGATKTEAINKLPHVHVYSQDWKKDASHHWRECAKDGDKNDFDNHTYDNGVVTKDATEYEYGKKKYTCTVCGYFYEENTPKIIIDRTGAEIVSANGFTINGNIGNISLPNTTETYSFINQITVSDYATWVISTDIYGMNTVATKTIPLNIGDNTIYLLVTSGDGNNINLYTMTVRRRPIYTVNFITAGGTAVSSQNVEETYLATAPTTTRAGYTFNGWDYDFGPIMQNETVTASWTANTDTPYKVEYYLQNLEDDEYTLTETSNLTGTTDTTANATIKAYEHFTFTENNSVLSGNIDGNGSRVLKVYYTRDKYSVRISAGENVSVTNAVNGTYKYGYLMNGSTSLDNYLGYEWDGWYLNGDFLTNEISIPDFIAVRDVNYIAKSKVRDEMQNFNFSSSTTTCSITGVKDKTVTEIIVPDYVTNIGNTAFINCTGLTSVTIPDSVTSIGYSAFKNCTGLTSITIPDSVTSIGSDVLGGCSSLQSLTIPFVGNRAGVTSSDTYQYPLGYLFGTSSYTGGTSTQQYYYGSSASNRTNNTYYIPASLRSVIVIGGYIPDGAFYNCSMLTSITLGDSVTSIGNYAFSGCTGLTSVTIGNGVTSIGSYAFYNCTGLTSVTIPDSVTSIGNWAFYGCTRLTSITIPDGVTSIGNSAFVNCYKLVEVYNKSSLIIMKGSSSNGLVGYYAKAIYTEPYESKLSIDENGYILYTDGDDISLIGYTGTDTVLALPEGITEIYQHAFYNDTSITSVIIPNSVTSIGNYAFYNCTGLTSVTIGNGVTSIGNYAFYNCTGLTSVTIGNGVTSIGNSAFNNCTGLTSVYITDIASWCGITFGNDYSSNPLSYAHNLYINNELVTNLVIPNTVTEIKRNAFIGATCLTSVTIPDSVMSIREHAFSYCTGLTSITYQGTIAQWNAISKDSYWNYNTGSYTIYCTDGTLNK